VLSVLFGALEAAAALAILAVVSAPAAFAAPAPPAARPDILTVDEIRPGMTGVGKTVFRGTEVEEFQVEVIGVLRKVSPNGDMILARASGGPLAETGIIEGMSGSPVYIEGRLVGAVAFSWPFSKEPIAGITPIREMLEVMDRADRAPDERADASGAPGAPGGAPDALGALAPLAAPLDPRVAGIDVEDGARLRPIRTPVVISGFDPRVSGRVTSWLEGLGFTATPGGSAAPAAPAAAPAGESPAPPEIAPGSAIGVQLLSGDASITAIGTVTHREGDRIIAFGHPFMLSGDVALPMTGAYIHGILPSALSSFKVGSPLDPLGTLTQDRRTAVSGNIGPTPAMIPVTVTIRAGDAPRTYRFAAVRSRLLTPALIQLAAVSSLVATEAVVSEETVETRVVAQLSGGRRLTLENRFVGDSSIESVADEAMESAALLLQNRFEAVALEGVEIEAVLTPGRRAGRLEAIRIPRNPVRPGETIAVEASVKTHQGPVLVVPIALEVPSGAPDGDLILRVCDAAGLEDAETKRAPERNDWEDLDTFLARLAARPRNDRLYAQLEAPNTGVTIAGREFPSIPRSVFAVIDSDRHTENAGVASASIVAKGEAQIGVVVSGCKTVPIHVDHKAP
jgi:hypothetical protein